MGEEDASRTPFLFFTDHHGELADAVREGRRSEFASFPAFADPARREQIPDPNAPATFAASVPARRPRSSVDARGALSAAHRACGARISCRASMVPRAGAEAIGPKAVRGALAAGRRRHADAREQSRRRAVPFALPAGALMFANIGRAWRRGLAGHAPSRSWMGLRWMTKRSATSRAAPASRSSGTTSPERRGRRDRRAAPHPCGAAAFRATARRPRGQPRAAARKRACRRCPLVTATAGGPIRLDGRHEACHGRN